MCIYTDTMHETAFSTPIFLQMSSVGFLFPAQELQQELHQEMICEVENG